MALFGKLAVLAEDLAHEGSRLKKRAAIARALTSVARGSVAETLRTAAGEAQLLETVSEPTEPVAAGDAADTGRFCLYLAGQPFPEADARRLNAGGAILSRALKEVSGASDSAMTAAYRRHGDLGAGAFDLLVAPYGQAPATATLTLVEVASAFDTMASARTTKVRSAAVEDLLRRATALEAKYLLKLMLGDMRIGVKQSLIEEAIAVTASELGLPADVADVRHAVMLEADLGRAVERALAGTLREARLTLFHPLGFMLASPVETPEEAIERFSPRIRKAVEAKPRKPKRAKKSAKSSTEEDVSEDFSDLPGTGLPDTLPHEADGSESPGEEVLTAEALPVNAGEISAVHAFLEDKFDGIRAQVHCGDPANPGRVALYSRSREDITESFPELEEAFREVRDEAGGLILDGEILGWDPVTNRALPFAVLGQRIGRKRVDDAMRRGVPVAFMAFDVMCEHGELTLADPLTVRRARLERIAERLQPVTVSPLAGPPQVRETKGEQRLLNGLFAEEAASPAMPRLLLSRAEFVESAEAIDRGYTDARARANEGVMIKAAGSAYLPGRRGLLWVKLKRELGSLDVVITGAEFGSGRRSQVLSDYTFAVRGPELPDGTAELLNVGKAYSGVTDAEVVELTEWLKAHTLEDNGHFRTVEPLRILEVTFNNIMRSDRHASGFALRFPRILRLRDDKPVAEIDTLARVEEIYQSQPDKPEELDAVESAPEEA